ncbi:hypothetical protein GLAREA_11368 [Glarea lozoyensis ATCC 20868]|uniref:Uncharacterized protein n=2 Tax=Glarea lozoyensis TaxID=101852 RepID=S3EBI4_GLAL2|nr:uncharacterized protein GLAREA_11368 [Glarea lozoyensis ATCC 20868]EHK96635.1 hypothetical protein M7I_7614 [Glarea lozoyensis 74030]EPE35668.1 hypothetical protein GLAREA_11368 [Glarea lozoyensis ATCC 20868]
MLFTTLTVSALGLASVAFAAPHLHSRKEVSARTPATDSLSSRGITWKPSKRSGNNNLFNYNSFGRDDVSNNDFFSFQQETIIVITEQQGRNRDDDRRRDDEDFAILIQQQLFLLQSQNYVFDNIRRNHFNSRNNNVNTVIIIVQEVNDNRRGDNRRRYYTRQIESNRNRDEQVVVIIQEQTVLVINGDLGISGSPTASGFAPQSTGISGQFQEGIYDPNAQSFGGFNPNINLLPFDVEQPQFGFGNQGADPALVAFESQEIIIAFQQEDQRSRDDNIQTVIAIKTETVVVSNII